MTHVSVWDWIAPLHSGLTLLLNQLGNCSLYMMESLFFHAMNALIWCGLALCALSPCKSNKTLTDLGCCSFEEQLIHYGHFVYPWMCITVWMWILLWIQCGRGLLTVMLKHWFTDYSCFRNYIPQGCLKWPIKPLTINKIFIVWNNLTQFSRFPVPPSAFKMRACV